MGRSSPPASGTRQSSGTDKLESNKKQRIDTSQMTKPVRVGALCAANIVRKTARGISLADGVGASLPSAAAGAADRC